MPKPEAFQPCRPDYHYLHFAIALPACFRPCIGQFRSHGSSSPLLKRPGLHAVGTPENDGTFPGKLLVSTS
jgi:hypothetical protein